MSLSHLVSLVSNKGEIYAPALGTSAKGNSKVQMS